MISSAAYAARYLAKNVVAAGLADQCTIQLSYAIGVAKPLSIYVDVGRNPNDIDTPKLEQRAGRARRFVAAWHPQAPRPQ